MKKVLLLIGFFLISLPFWIVVGAVFQYMCPTVSGTGIATLSTMGYFGTILIGVSIIIDDKPKG